jgi:RNA polymerase sigma-70 factor (ECF subfamily)
VLENAPARLSALVDEYYPFVWRAVRRLGVPQGDADDAAQQVFIVLARKLAAVRPGSEKRFLFQTALRVASDQRRSRRRRRELVGPIGTEACADPADPAPDAFDILARRDARCALDRILDGMPLELRAVFVLFELDELTMIEIAHLTGLRPGTVASRLRRARALFLAGVAQLESAPRGESR